MQANGDHMVIGTKPAGRDDILRDSAPKIHQSDARETDVAAPSFFVEKGAPSPVANPSSSKPHSPTLLKQPVRSSEHVGDVSAGQPFPFKPPMARTSIPETPRAASNQATDATIQHWNIDPDANLEYLDWEDENDENFGSVHHTGSGSICSDSPGKERINISPEEEEPTEGSTANADEAKAAATMNETEQPWRPDMMPEIEKRLFRAMFFYRNDIELVARIKLALNEFLERLINWWKTATTSQKEDFRSWPVPRREQVENDLRIKGVNSNSHRGKGSPMEHV